MRWLARRFTWSESVDQFVRHRRKSETVMFNGTISKLCLRELTLSTETITGLLQTLPDHGVRTKARTTTVGRTGAKVHTFLQKRFALPIRRARPMTNSNKSGRSILNCHRCTWPLPIEPLFACWAYLFSEYTNEPMKWAHFYTKPKFWL